MPRDIDVILRTLDTPDWVFLPPSRDRVMQDEVHDDARAEIARRRMDPSTPYAGWHAQATATTRDGSLARPQRIYFGGDRERVREHLRLLEAHGFAVLGGRTDREAFLLVRDAAPTAAEAAQLPALQTRLRLLADPELLPDAPVPLRTGEEDLLHATLRAAELAGSGTAAQGRTGTGAALRADALAALHRRGLATHDDVDAVLRGWREELGDRAPELARVAVDLRHPLADDLVLDLLADGLAPSALLVAWGDPRAVEGAHERAVRGGRRDVEAYLELAELHGATRRSAFLGLAEEVRTGAADIDGDTLAYLVPSVVASDGPLVERILTALVDTSLPPWLRAQVLSTQAALPVHLHHGIVRSGWRVPRPFGPSPDEPTPEQAQAVLDAWDAAARSASTAAGAAPWPGFGVRARRSRAWALETVTDLPSWQVDALRQHLARPDATETELATCLELLLVGGALRTDDVEPLRAGWRERLLVAPDRYALARPAVVSFASVLLRSGDPLGRQVVEALLADGRRWAAGPRHLLLAETGGRDAAERLWAAAMVDGPGSREAAHGWVLLDARAGGHDTGTAAARGWEAVPDGGPLWRRYHLVDAAITWADPVRPAWGTTAGTGSVRQVRAALDLAARAGTPLAFRARALEVATGSRVLRSPQDAEPVAVPVEVVTGLRARAAALEREIAGPQG